VCRNEFEFEFEFAFKPQKAHMHNASRRRANTLAPADLAFVAERLWWVTSKTLIDF